MGQSRAIQTAQDKILEEIMTPNEAAQYGLDQWKCGRDLAMQLIDVYTELKTIGVDEETLRMRLAGGVVALNDLTEAQALEAIKAFNHWLNAYKEIVREATI
jgi:NAD-dependent DNA ligase